MTQAEIEKTNYALLAHLHAVHCCEVQGFQIEIIGWQTLENITVGHWIAFMMPSSVTPIYLWFQI